ncbi:MAG: BtpA/SgcQ family protein [Verrucomicrobiales bacterium]|nr:BtpA/SgcQ family protein [Verrucomicrobiales bacterium]
MEEVIKSAVSDAKAIMEGGFDAVIVENFGDTPFFKTAVPPETVAAMTRAAVEIRREIEGSIPLGFNVLRNDPAAALGLCAVCDGDFIRVNVHTGAMLTDQGIIEGDAAATVRKRDQICPEAGIFADILVKHATPLAPISIEQAAKDTWHRGKADALIISGTGTGEATDLADLKAVREAVPEAQILVGSGATAGNAKELLEFADGLIVGTSLKNGEAIDPAKVAELRAAC